MHNPVIRKKILCLNFNRQHKQVKPLILLGSIFFEQSTYEITA